MTKYQNKVGTALKDLIPEWAAKQNKGCGCKSKQTLYDRNGVDWCEQHREEIIDGLVENKDLLTAPLKVMPDNILRFGAATLVDTAIKMAKQTEQVSSYDTNSI